MANLNLKNKNEKHYTDNKLINLMFNLMEKYIIPTNHTLLENSAGKGYIIDEWIKRYNLPYIAYDIEPERNDIIKSNYLKTDIPNGNYITIMNPPFTLGNKFLNKAIDESEYVVSILSSSTIMSINENIDIIEGYLIKNYDFNSCETDISIIICKKKE